MYNRREGFLHVACQRAFDAEEEEEEEGPLQEAGVPARPPSINDWEPEIADNEVAHVRAEITEVKVQVHERIEFQSGSCDIPPVFFSVGLFCFSTRSLLTHY
jgi:hypothetical protein